MIITSSKNGEIVIIMNKTESCSMINALTENNIIGTSAGQTKPDYVLLSHILELSHESEEESRWSLNSALERASKLNCENSVVPFWGEKLVWKDGKLN